LKPEKEVEVEMGKPYAAWIMVLRAELIRLTLTALIGKFPISYLLEW
jgi:hypothetical protein